MKFGTHSTTVQGNVHLESSDGEKRELSEEQQKQLAEFLTLLRVFLKTVRVYSIILLPCFLRIRSLRLFFDKANFEIYQARHDDLRSVIDDHSNLSLIERMKKAIAIAKERDAEKVNH